FLSVRSCPTAPALLPRPEPFRSTAATTSGGSQDWSSAEGAPPKVWANSHRDTAGVTETGSDMRLGRTHHMKTRHSAITRRARPLTTAQVWSCYLGWSRNVRCGGPRISLRIGPTCLVLGR